MKSVPTLSLPIVSLFALLVVNAGAQPVPAAAPATPPPPAPAPAPAPVVVVVKPVHHPMRARGPLYHQTTVAWVVANRDNLDVDDRYVTLVGRVTRQIGDEEYWFTDGTGSVRLDAENFDLPVGPRLIIGGRIDQAYLGFGHLEVDVRHWHYAR